MKYLLALLLIIVSIIFAVSIAFGLGFIVQLLLNPILTYFGIKTVTTTICACIILLIGLIRLAF